MIKKEKTITKIRICTGSACSGNFSKYIFERAMNDLGITDPEGGESANGKFILEKSGCLGNCKLGPTVVIERKGKTNSFSKVTPISMSKIIKQYRSS